jgi:hypothetical protein
MAEAEEPKAGRLKKRRQKQQKHREQTADTPQAAAERARGATSAPEYDADTMKKRVGNPGASFFS